MSAAALLAGLIVQLPAVTARAHEGRSLGDLEMEVGFGTEPAYAGQPNSVQVVLVHDGEPVVGLGDTLEVEVTFGDQSTTLPLEPFFEEGEFGTPGDYRAWFIPTRPGRYAFHLSGTIEGEEVDETFTSGPKTFGDVEDPRSAEFPVQDPSTGELADRIDREVPRLTAAIDDLRAEAIDRAQTVAADASSAKTLGVIGLIVGALGLIVAIVALVSSRRRGA
jgi:hypothetical protein